MPAARLPMRKVKDILRLVWGCGLSSRQVASSLGMARSTVGEYLRRAAAAGLSWPLPEGLDEEQMDRRLFPPAVRTGPRARPVPDWEAVRQELRRKDMTLFLLWGEYKEDHPEGYQYSRFCDLYAEWQERRSVWLRQDHKAGEKMFVDYAGASVSITDAESGAVRPAQVFVAVLGASSYTYAEATWTQTLPDWIDSHIRAFEAFGGVPELVVSDNLKSAVTRPCRYDPEINPAYAEMLAHYGTAAMPARVRRPRDKAKAESGVQVVQRWVLARLRHRTFFSLREANEAIRPLLAELNVRPFRKLPGSRRSQFETLDRPALRPLPSTRYEMAEWRKVRVHPDSHIEHQGHYYSVPCALRGREIEARVTAGTIELFFRGQRVASHPRSAERGRHTTVPEHLPAAHRAYLEGLPVRLEPAGPSTRQVMDQIMASRRHPYLGFRACQGLQRLGRIYGPERLEAACARALEIGGLTYRSIASLLKCGLDGPHARGPLRTRSQAHANIRGADYFGGKPC